MTRSDRVPTGARFADADALRRAGLSRGRTLGVDVERGGERETVTADVVRAPVPGALPIGVRPEEDYDLPWDWARCELVGGSRGGIVLSEGAGGDPSDPRTVDVAAVVVVR